MPRLILLRHAKSAWPGGVDDHERPLAPRGEKAAQKMGAYMMKEGLVPDLALVSSARRTRQTWSLVQPYLPGNREVRYLDELYEATPEEIAEAIRKHASYSKAVLLIGHNPGLQDLALSLAQEGEGLISLRIKFPTAGLAVLDFSTSDWPELTPGTGRLERFVTPKSLE